MKGSYSDLNRIRLYVNEWQNSIYHHPLTCGNDSRNHKSLVTQLEKRADQFELFLVCEDCNWKQDIPPYLR
ncbi:hypothetical protein LCM23_13145 [Cytobacillus kochii]|uniref:hypothetical protein n=1 Tax=Cytobacillus kochii TaxID=859143 RepID=UPI001CD31455|nr:hypothetical protein [Cytobacillus kochii]MCA1027041.1 hypothetical protein [Cytobacillus kochii]